MSVRVQDNTKNVLQRVQTGSRVALRLMAGDIHRAAKPITPRKTGELSKDVVIKAGSPTTITWTQPYAAVQERGSRRGARAFTKYTTGGTGKGYAEKAVKEITDRSETYFKRSIR